MPHEGLIEQANRATAYEAAQIFGVAYSSLWYAITTGALPTIAKSGGPRRLRHVVDLADVEAYLIAHNECRTEGTELRRRIMAMHKRGVRTGVIAATVGRNRRTVQRYIDGMLGYSYKSRTLPCPGAKERA